mgnify:CR=1 FL=1
MDDVLVLVQPQLVQNDIGDFAPAGPPLKTADIRLHQLRQPCGVVQRRPGRPKA